ncbi:unnamed protein product, partial [Laminaria digitata]
GLRVGQRVETPHGEGKILGSLRSDVWFSLDGDDSGAWYWTREELSDLLNSASVRLVEGSGDAVEGGGGGGGGSDGSAEGEGEVAVRAASTADVIVGADGGAEADADANPDDAAGGTGGASANADTDGADIEAAPDADTETVADSDTAAGANPNASANANVNADSNANAIASAAGDSASAAPAPPAPAGGAPENETGSASAAATGSSAPQGGGGGGGAPSGAGDDRADADSAATPAAAAAAAASAVAGSARCGSREFTALATEGWGSLALDEALVRVANLVAGRRGVPPSHLSEGELAAAVEAAGPGLGGSELASIDAEKLGARLLLLVELNARLSVALPLLDLAREFKAPLAVTKSDLRRAAVVPGVSLGVGSPSGAAVADLRGLLFTQTKTSYWNTVVQETTTFTLPNPDEYERPEEIREIEVNRVKARSVAVEGEALGFGDKLRASLFGQLNEAMSDWEDRDLRRSFVHMQDAGQARAFYVRFKGEGVDDHGGPYRAVFQTAMGEEPSGLLSLLTPCPNGRNHFGPNQDKVLLDPRSSAAGSVGGGVDPARLSLFHHMGRLLGVAGRHRIHVPLALPSLVWKPLVGATLGAGDLEAVDKMLAKGLSDILAGRLDQDEEREVLEDALMACAEDAGGGDAALLPGQRRRAVRAVEQLRLTSGSRCLEALYQGLAGVLPVELLAVFTAAEAEALFCGVPEVDVDLLQRATEYEGVRPTDTHVGYFWQALRKMDSEDRAAFVNFCSGRSRLPGSAAEFAMNFKLTAPHRDYDEPDNYLPIAQTCFFSLALPKYSSMEICLAKLRYAIKNADLMDADYLVRSADGWEHLR